jgi:diguanylate cyclase (GGDEF)-like protein
VLHQSRQAALTFLMADANKFKQINSRFGHLTGDFVLSEIAGILKASIRGSDAAVRYGGDEFLILLADTSADGADIVVRKIHTRRRCIRFPPERQLCTFPSVGVVITLKPSSQLFCKQRDQHISIARFNQVIIHAEVDAFNFTLHAGFYDSCRLM